MYGQGLTQQVTNIYEKEIAGVEFDWFAEDLNGNLAIFSTAGEGPVPTSVIENYILHREISDSIESPRWGSSDVWSDYSTLGLFVYDWNLPGGPYIRIKFPENEMPIELKEKILKITNIPKFDKQFNFEGHINDSNFMTLYK